MKISAFLLLLFSSPVFCQTPGWKNITTNTNASFRGLSVVDDSVAWVSGSNGWVGRSTNGGNNWFFIRVKGFEKADFRSLYAFNAQAAIIANAGSPADILITNDGGLHWRVVYTNADSAAFFDGMDFWNNTEGIIYGDPIHGRMLLLHTNNGGQSWQEMQEQSSPLLSPGEASFAASGTGIRCMGTQKVSIATGGKVSRLLISKDKGLHWNSLSSPILQGEKSTGIFSLAYLNDTTGVIVGGDYKRDTLTKAGVFYTKDAGQHWLAPLVPTRGYRECAEYITGKQVIATGPTGTDISYDGGMNWKSLSDEKSFHAVRKARKGTAIILAGSNGRITLFK